MSEETKQYNPDVLSCIANLSNDEVFTPPEVANAMLNILPQELFRNPETTFLDPAAKSGVFLREIAKRLMEGLKDAIPDEEERRQHIFKNQIFGITITELTGFISRRSLYCSKAADGKYSVAAFDNPEGNIRFNETQHTWERGKCRFCGASQEKYGGESREGLETHAYEFIHTLSPEEIFNMKFDVIISNPPYQLETGGSGRQAKPIYNLFVEQAKKLNPRYISLIIPSRWFAGGFGLDEFRSSMLLDDRIRVIVDYPNSAEVFSGVDISGGVCYFLWCRDSRGMCSITNNINGEKFSDVRNLDEFPTFVRDSKAIGIIRKVFAKENSERTLEQRVSPQKPFGLPTNYVPRESGIPCWFIQRIGRKFADKTDVNDVNGYLDKWKLLLPKSPIAGQTDFTKPVGFYYDGNTRIAKPGECCTESWIVAGAFDSEEEVMSFKSYLFTKIARFLLLQTVVSQDVLRNKFCFVPDLAEYSGLYTDDRLRTMWNITDEEWIYIDSRISTITQAEMQGGILQNVLASSKELYYSRVKHIGLSKNNLRGNHYNVDESYCLDKYKVIVSSSRLDGMKNMIEDSKCQIIYGNVTVYVAIVPPNKSLPSSGKGKCYFVVDTFVTRTESENLIAFLKTDFVNYLVLQNKFEDELSIDLFKNVPVLNFGEALDDNRLCHEVYNLTSDDIVLIQSARTN